MTQHPRALAPAKLTWADGIPQDTVTGDIYFNRQDPVRESQAVFLQGNDLPARLGDHERPVHRVGETGFGTGLNFLLLWDAWLRLGAPRPLTYISFEQAPLAPPDRQRFREGLRKRGAERLLTLAKTLEGALPEPLEGWHFISLEGGRLRLHLYLGAALQGLDDWLAQRDAPAVDAWFLDGFAPKVGPELWHPPLLRQLAAASAPRATLGTFTVARAVRDALGASGFVCRRVPGPKVAGDGPRKREVLTATLAPGLGRAASAAPERAVILGAGLAGTAAALALAEQGIHSDVFEAGPRPGGGASANPWALLHPRLPIDEGPRGPFLWQAYRLALQRVQGQAGFFPRPLRQYREKRRPDRLVKASTYYHMLAPRLRLLEEGDGAGPFLELRESGYANLPQLLSALWPARAQGHFHTPVTALEGSAGGWRLRGSAGEELLEGTEAQPVILATGAALKALAPVATGQVGGQLDRFAGPALTGAPLLSGRGHGFHDGAGWVVGSTYRHAPPWSTTTAADRNANRARLAAWHALLGWPEAGGAHQQSFAGLRANSPDRAPHVGALASGFLVSTGHASSGLTTAFLAGEILASAIAGAPPVADLGVLAHLDPQRFATTPAQPTSSPKW